MTIWTVRLVSGEEEEEEEKRDGGVEEWRGEERTEETIKENVNTEAKALTKDTKHATFLSSFLSADTSLESSDCGRLLSNRNPVEKLCQRERERTVAVINQRYRLHRPTGIHLHTGNAKYYRITMALCYFVTYCELVA